MQPATAEKSRRFLIPPWSVILIQCVWMLTLVLAFRTGFATSSVWHFLIGGMLSLFLVVGLYCRWRWTLWVSAILFAGALGGTMARRVASLGDGIGSQQADLFFVVALFVQAGGWFIHQISVSFRWLGLERTGSVRLWFGLLSFLAFCVWALVVYRGLSRQG